MAAIASLTAARPQSCAAGQADAMAIHAADADAHERANFEQLETDGAAGSLRELGIVSPIRRRAHSRT